MNEYVVNVILVLLSNHNFVNENKRRYMLFQLVATTSGKHSNVSKTCSLSLFRLVFRTFRLNLLFVKQNCRKIGLGGVSFKEYIRAYFSEIESQSFSKFTKFLEDFTKIGPIGNLKCR